MMSRVHSFEIEHITPEAPRENEIRTESDNCNHRRRELSRRLRPILRLMKLAGEYYGDSSLVETPQESSNHFSRFYCASVLLGQCVIFVQAITSIFFEGFAQMQNTYFLLMFSIWYLECAGINESGLGGLGGLTKRGLKTLLALACCAVAFNSICLAALVFYRCISVARFQPWNGLLAYRLLHLVFRVFKTFTWVLPVLLLCVLMLTFVGNVCEFAEEVIHGESHFSRHRIIEAGTSQTL